MATVAEDEDWSRLHLDYAEQMYNGTHRRLLGTLYRLSHPLLPRPEIGEDVVRTCQALLSYNGREVLEAIDAPTLVVFDTDGPLFPHSEQRDAAR